MASNYNRVPKSGVVELVNRQSFHDTFINDLCLTKICFKIKHDATNRISAK